MSPLFRRRDDRDERRALAVAKVKLELIEQQWPAVHRAVEAMDAHGRRNGFAEQIRIAMGVKQ
jgi:hypothetical protein